MRTVDWSQHLSSSQHRSGTGYKHQFYLGSLFERTIQREQPAAQGYDFQASRDTLAIREPHYRWGSAVEVQAWRTRLQLHLGEGAHCNAEYRNLVTTLHRLRKGLYTLRTEVHRC